ncbi:unnamed protein product [Bathycoccus prasinos]|mgnify:CR=1 FL=1|jgi:hypothetical protein
MGCCVSKHEEGREGKEEENDKDPIKSTLNSLKKKKNININNTKSVTKSDSKNANKIVSSSSPSSRLELIRAWSGEQATTSSSKNKNNATKTTNEDEDDERQMNDFLIAKMLFEEDELEEKNRKMATQSDFLLAQSLREEEEIEEERAENESYEMLLERWKRRVGQERIESWSRKLDGVVREQVLNTPLRKSHGDDRSKVKRQMSVPITPKRNQDEDLRIALQLSREDSEKVERDHDVLLARLDAFGLREKVVSGDGNCQFRALSDQLFRTPEYYEEVRKNVVGQLRKYASRYAAYVVAANEEGGSKNTPSSSSSPQSSTEEAKSAFFMMQTAYSNYCDDMASDGTWGDHVTLQAAADLYGAQITVVTSYLDNGVLEITPIRTSSSNKKGGDSSPPDDGKNPSWSEKFGERNLWLSFWAEVHYNSVYPKLEFRTPESGKKSGRKNGTAGGYYDGNENANVDTGASGNNGINNNNNNNNNSSTSKGTSSRTAIRSQASKQNDAALRIQTSFRGAQARKKVINSRHLLQRSIETLKIHDAASVIQRAYRVHRAERIEQEEYEKVMQRITSNTPEKFRSPEFYSSPLRDLRGFGQRELFKSPKTPEERTRDFLRNQRAFEEKTAAIKIQKIFRGVLERKRMLDASEDDPAKKLQALVRTEMALNAYRELKSKQTNAAMKMQALARGAIARKRLKEANEAALKIQSMVKMHKAKKDLREMKAKRLESARKLQALARGAIARKRLKEANDAATKIQSLVKMQKAKKALEELHIKRNESALKLQAMVRGVFARKRLAEAQQAAIKIQSMVKMQKAKKEFQDLQERRRQSALKIQAFTRGVIARKRFNETKSAAIKIQSVIKMAKEREQFQKQRRATLVIQARVRATLEGRKEREKFQEKRNAVRKMQSLFRMAIEKKRYQETKDAVVKMQSIARVKLAKREFELLKKHHATAQKMQSIYRGQLVRKRQNELKRRAVAIQSAFRGYKTRKKYNLHSYYVGWETANKTTWSGNSSSDEEDVEWTREYYLKSYSNKDAFEEHHENMVKAGILPPKTSEPFSPRTSLAFNNGMMSNHHDQNHHDFNLESHPAPMSPPRRRRKKRNWSRRLIGRRRNGGFDSDSTDEEDDSAAEKEYQEPNSVLIKTIAKTSGHTVLVRKPIDLEASSAMKKKLAFEFDQMDKERKEKEFREMEKEKKRLQNSRKSTPRRIKDALKSAFVDKPAKVARGTFDVLTSKHAMELLLKSAIAFFAFDAFDAVRSNHRERVRRHRFGRDDKPVLVIKTSNRSFFGGAKTKAT